jgi:hypothetical protein
MKLSLSTAGKSFDPRFDINVLLIANNSASKDMLLRALYRANESSCIFPQETTGVRAFRIQQGADPTGALDNDDTIFGQNQLQTIVYDVVLKDGKCMEDTDLFIVDVPGLNEDRCNVEEYVTKNWDSFDVVISVLDATSDEINPGKELENRKLLAFIKDLCDESSPNFKRRIPHICVLNKVDCSVELLTETMIQKYKDIVDGYFGGAATFVSVASQLALLFYTIKTKNIDEFHMHYKSEPDLINAVGIAYCMGFKEWKKLKDDEKRAKVYNHFDLDKKTLKESIAESNFETFRYELGSRALSKESQSKMTRDKQEFRQKSLVTQGDPDAFISSATKNFEQRSELGYPADLRLPDTVWDAFTRFEDLAFNKVKGPMDAHHLAGLLIFLRKYYEFAYSKGWESEKQETIVRIMALIRRQVDLLLKKSNSIAAQAMEVDSVNQESGEEAISFSNMTLVEWYYLLQNVLRAFEYVDPTLRLEFDHEVEWLQVRHDSVKGRVFNGGLATHQALACRRSADGILVPLDSAAYKKYNRLSRQTGMEDPKSWAYLTFQGFELIEDCRRVELLKGPSQVLQSGEPSQYENEEVQESFLPNVELGGSNTATPSDAEVAAASGTAVEDKNPEAITAKNAEGSTANHNPQSVWKEAVDPRTGRTDSYDAATKPTQWEKVRSTHMPSLDP